MGDYPGPTLAEQLRDDNEKLRDALDKARRAMAAQQEAHTASLLEWTNGRRELLAEIEKLREELGRRTLTQRGHFAGAALTGLLSTFPPPGKTSIDQQTTHSAAAASLMFADAMLAEMAASEAAAVSAPEDASIRSGTIELARYAALAACEHLGPACECGACRFWILFGERLRAGAGDAVDAT